MFGYIRVFQPDLRFREMDCYRGVYCGLCRAQGDCTGQCSRMMLSYDFAFMALVRTMLAGETVRVEARRCPLHPFHRRPIATVSDSLRVTALSASLLAWHKLQDDQQDERGGKYWRAALVLPLAGYARRRALRRTVLSSQTENQDKAGSGSTDGSELDAMISASMASLHQLERKASPSVDEPAELFGTLLGDLLGYGLGGDSARIARQIGKHTGRWIYILDAAEDFSEDVRRNRYNPFRCLCPPDTEVLPESNRESIRLALNRETDGISAALDLANMPDENAVGAIRNIVGRGMPHTAQCILFPESINNTQKRN